MTKNKRTSLLVDIVMFLFGVSQLATIAAYILFGRSTNCNNGPGFADGCDPSLIFSIIAGAISLAYLLFLTVLTALSTSRLLKRLQRATTYKTYAEVYDDFKGDRQKTIDLLGKLIRKHRPQAESMLDLACGTGSIAQGFADSYELVGMDNAPAMLNIAKEKLPGIPFLKGSMPNFKINRKFDVIYCLHNSVNHLLTFREWQKLFKNCAEHLNEGGILIFDINPIEKMDTLVRLGLGTTQVKDGYVTTQVTRDAAKAGLYHWDVKIFSKRGRDTFSVKHEAIKVSTYPLAKVEQDLRKNFDIVDSFLLDRGHEADDVGRAYYVCSVHGRNR